MKIRSTIIAVVLALASAAAAWFAWQLDRQSASTGIQGPRRLFEPGEIPIDDVERITVARGNTPPMVFERRESVWMQIAPAEYPVDLFSMRQIIIAAHDLETVGEPVAQADAHSLETMSLDPPLAVVTLEWPAGSTTLDLGRKGVGGLAYVRVQGDERVQLVRQALHDRALEQSPFEWRRKRIFDNAGIDSTRITFDEPGALGYSLAKDGRAWRMTSPVEARLDSAAVEEHLALLGSVQVASFIADAPDDLSRYGLDSPRATVDVATPVRAVVDGQPREVVASERLLLGAAQSLEAGSSCFAKLQGRNVVFTLPRALIERIAASGHLIDLRALAVNPADVRSIRISAEEEFTIARDRVDPTKWIAGETEAGAAGAGETGGGETGAGETEAGATGTDGAAVNGAMVDALFQSLTAARAEDAEGGDFPFDRRLGHITFFDFSGEPLAAVQVARREDGRWVLFSDDHLLRIFPASTAIPLARDQYLERE